MEQMKKNFPVSDYNKQYWDEEDKYGVTGREKHIFKMAQENVPMEDWFTDADRALYNGYMSDFLWCDKVGKSRKSIVQWFND